MATLQKINNIKNKDYFNFKNYKTIIKYLKSNYNFLIFDKNYNSKKGVFLRHDIDIHPCLMEKLMSFYEIEDIKCNIFFLLNSQNYNILSNNFQYFAKDLSKKGHLLGLHYCNNLNLKSNEFQEILSYLKKKLKFKNVISYHQPKQKNLFKKYDKFISTYERRFFSDDIYVSDSNRKKEFLKKLIYLTEIKKEKKIQVLIHPVWWFGKVSEVYPCIEKFNKKNYNKYISEISKKLII